MEMGEKQLAKYSRQIVLSQIGIAGQKKLFGTNVLIVGAGGLGSAALLYLAGSGVGKIGIVDFDVVDESNLHRQIIHSQSDIGKPKVDSAKEKINNLNKDVEVVTFKEKLSEQNTERIMKDFDIVVDGLDNFNDKYLVNDVAVSLKKKIVHAGVIGYEGQVMSIVPGKSSCLRCILPEIPKNHRQKCSEVGVLGTCVGMISILQANEVIKLALGIGDPLINRIVKFDALRSSFYELKLNYNEVQCSMCKKWTVDSGKWKVDSGQSTEAEIRI